MTDPDERNTEIIEIFQTEIKDDCGEYTDEDIYYQGMSDMEDKCHT